MTAVQLIGQQFDASKLEPDENGLLILPGWMAIRCPTAERSAQTSAETVRTGHGANAARAVSRDGSSWGLLAWKAMTNLIDEQDLSRWTKTGSITVVSTSDPAGGNNAWEVEDASAVEAQSVNLSIPVLSASTVYAMSEWSWQVAFSGGGVSSFLSNHDVGGNEPRINLSAVDAGWNYRSDNTPTPAGISSTLMELFPAATADAAQTGIRRSWGMQLELGAYPSPFMGTDNSTFSCAADVLRVEPEAFAPGGRFHRTLRWRPGYADTELASGAGHNLVYFDADNRIYFDADTATIVMRIGGVEFASAALTFSRYQELELIVEHTDSRRLLRVSGATTGNGFVQQDPVDPIELPDTYVHLLGTDAGAEEGAELAGVLYSGPDDATFCDITDRRALVQMNSDEPPDGSQFRDLLCILAEDPARFFDVCTAIKNALAHETAEGKQLDMIGSVIGLSREGFGDDRYKTFLQIQTELLLSAARDDAEWTGTGPNILRIVRTFVGPDADPILLINQPPYSYEISAGLVDIDETDLLVRFLRKASYAAVRGLALINLDSVNESVMGSDAVAVTNAGIMGSDSVAVTDAMIMGTVRST